MDNDRLSAPKLGGILIEIPRYEYDKKDKPVFQEIEKILHPSTPDRETHEEIIGILNEYEGRHHYWRKAPERKKVKAVLSKFYKVARAFQVSLTMLQSGPTEGGRHQEAALVRLLRTKTVEGFDGDLSRPTSDVSRLVAGAKQAMEDLPHSKGRALRDSAFYFLVCDLAALYSRKTGEPAKLKWTFHVDEAGQAVRRYGGPFFELVKACWALLGSGLITSSRR